MQRLASDVALVRALRPLPRKREELSVLDVGCGDGNTLLSLIGLGFHPSQLTGIDLLPERIHDASERIPGAHLIIGDARQLHFPSNSFDIVLESTIFLQIVDDVAAKGIADEMVRVVKPTGSLLLRDWRIGNPRDPSHRPLNRTRLTKLFGVGKVTRIVSVEPGSLVPPVGRFLSRRAPWAYFLVQSLLPFLAGLTVTRLQRTQ